ncbi:MAG: GNAT family N-acetyltransferase [Antricoccus sp.]
MSDTPEKDLKSDLAEHPRPETDSELEPGPQIDSETEADADPDPVVVTTATTRRRRLFTRKAHQNPDIPEYNVRICRLEDLAAFENSTYVHPEIVRSWLALQQFGEVTLLVMWHRNTTPAGQVLISWTGDWDDEVRKALPGVPALCNLHIEDEHRGHGLARQLIDAAEKLARGTGYARLTIGVDESSTDVKKYGDLGFHDSELRTESSYSYKDAAGKKQSATERIAALVKDLTPKADVEDEPVAETAAKSTAQDAIDAAEVSGAEADETPDVAEVETADSAE